MTNHPEKYSGIFRLVRLSTIFAVIVVAIMVYAVYRRYKMWHLGKPDSRLKAASTPDGKPLLILPSSMG